jgi:hypothetical protein
MEVVDADPRWAVGFCDECWWSRVALPTLSSFSEEKKTHRMIQRSVAKDDPDPKAISCYGLYLPEIGETWLRFVDGRPGSSITTRFLSWCCEGLEVAGKDSAAHLGQRELARLQRGEAMAREAQPPRQKERLWGEDRKLPPPQAESVAERYRAQVGTRKTESSRVRRRAEVLRARRQGLRGVRLYASRSSLHSPGGHLIMH